MTTNASLCGMRCFVLIFTIALSQVIHGGEKDAPNLIPNGDFRGQVVNGLPEGWVAGAVRPSLAPTFSAQKRHGKLYLRATGGGNPDCVGWVSTAVKIERGKTYWFRVRFRKSDSLNPAHHLQFQILSGAATQRIGEFHRLDGDWVEGEARICFPGEGTADAQVRIVYRLCAEGEMWIESISLTETQPVEPRWVRVACTSHNTAASLEEYGLEAFRKALDVAGHNKADLALLPEYMNGEIVPEPLSGPSAQLMSEKSKQYGMVVAGTIARRDEATDRLYNTALLFGRDGKLIGAYDKVHLDGPELNDEGITPGDHVPVFQTDFGKVGFMTCYDSWFPDVAELLALKGADIILFPNLGYDRELMHARALDNCVNLATSSRSGNYGVWDAAGREALSQTAPSPSFNNLVETRVDNVRVLIVSLDLNAQTQQHRGGSLLPSVRSKRYSANQRVWLEEQIQKEKLRWWAE